MTTTKIVRTKLPQNGETSGTAGTYAKAVNDAIGATTAANTQISSCVKGGYIITTIVLFA